MITLLTASSEDFWFLNQLSAPNKLEYCLRWQHQIVIRKIIPNPWGWKPLIVKDLLNEIHDNDWIWFMGADTLIMNQTIDVRRFIDEQYDFIIGRDYNGINNDVFFLKKTVASINFIDEIIKLISVCNSDQEAMIQLMNKIPDLKSCIVSQKLFNAYLYDTEPAYASYPRGYEGNFAHGDFVLHFPGMDNIRRQQLLQMYLPHVIR